ncbi:MAG: 50S ribosomal protein L21 [Planctomycetota bacterium]
MYAIIQDRGRQTTVRVGDVVDLDLDTDAEPGATLRFEKVLLLGGEGGVRLGAPTVAGASVTAEVLGEQKGDKLVAFRFRRRKNVRVKRGHRQRYTRVKVTAIEG